jgi:hypothetical protein
MVLVCVCLISYYKETNMQSSYQFHFGGANPVFGGGGLWGSAQSGATGGAASGGGAGGGFSISSVVEDVGVHEKNGSSVKEYAYTEDKNFRFRPAMEDSKTFFAKL